MEANSALQCVYTMLSKQNPCPVLIAHLFIFMVLGIEPKTLYMLGMYCTS
jgi:hypothetical protein